MNLIRREDVAELLEEGESRRASTEGESEETEVPHSVRRIYRDRSCPFDTLDDESFRRRYRFTRRGFFRIVERLEIALERTTEKSIPLSTAQQLAIVIRVLAARSFQLHAADSFGVSQSTVSRVVADVSDWFASHDTMFVHWHSANSQRAMSRRVRALTRIPNIVGAIDGSHIPILRPSTNEHAFINRKNFASINLGAIVDDRYKFLWYSARFPGRAHDSRVWRESALYHAFATHQLNGWIVGDSAYRAESFLIKPFTGAHLSRKQVRYNRAISRFRARVEQAFGQLKRQFHALQAGLRYAPARASRLIATAICLRNAAIDSREPSLYGDCDFEEEHEELEETEDDEDEDGWSDQDLPSGRDLMLYIADRYF